MGAQPEWVGARLAQEQDGGKKKGFIVSVAWTSGRQDGTPIPLRQAGPGPCSAGPGINPAPPPPPPLTLTLCLAAAEALTVVPRRASCTSKGAICWQVRRLAVAWEPPKIRAGSWGVRGLVAARNKAYLVLAGGGVSGVLCEWGFLQRLC